MSDCPSAVRCPACDGPVPFGPDLVLAEVIACRECGTGLEVTCLAPPAVAEAPAEEEDWGE